MRRSSKPAKYAGLELPGSLERINSLAGVSQARMPGRIFFALCMGILPDIHRGVVWFMGWGFLSCGVAVHVAAGVAGGGGVVGFGACGVGAAGDGAAVGARLVVAGEVIGYIVDAVGDVVYCVVDDVSGIVEQGIIVSLVAPPVPVTLPSVSLASDELLELLLLVLLLSLVPAEPEPES